MRIWAAVSAGGALGALARYALAAGWPDRPGGFPWATFVINVSGCLLIGAVLALVGGDARVARAFLAPGVLGGYT
ncbi:MAG TPA: CrcB family protein, partial [Micromonosporaceae bacterium]|nr:CrcB family protein [Micromonosporaceae bacterium]